jgi:profilin
VTKLVQGLNNTDLLTANGVTLAGQRYIYLSDSDTIVRAKFGKVGLHVMKTKQGEAPLSILFISFLPFKR